jgi:hypothetical protein
MEYTEKELKKYYVVGCQGDKSCGWEGLSRDVEEIVCDYEEESDSVTYICPNCGEVLTIIK